MRITELTVTTEAQNTDFLAIDDATLGTRKIAPDDLVLGSIGSALDNYVSYGVDTVTTEKQANARYNLGIGLATTESEGLVQLYNGVDSTSTTKAATAAAVKLAYEHGGGGGSGPITVYTSVSNIGLTPGSATVSGIWSAMSSESMLLCEVTDLSSGERPFTTASGTLQVYKKGTSSGFIEIHGKKDADGDWRMFIASNAVPSGTWIFTENSSVTGTVTEGDITPTTTTDNFYLARIGQVVYFMIRFKPNVSNASLIICTLPTGFRPTARIVVPALRVWSRASASTAPETLAVVILNTGAVQVNTSSGALTDEYFIQTSFPII